jgi:hypothetical protein
MESEDQENLGDHHNIPGTNSQAEKEKENEPETVGPCPSRSMLAIPHPPPPHHRSQFPFSNNIEGLRQA